MVFRLIYLGIFIMATPAAERKKAERQNKRNQGLVQKEIWFQPDTYSLIKRFLENNPDLTFEDAVNRLILVGH